MSSVKQANGDVTDQQNAAASSLGPEQLAELQNIAEDVIHRAKAKGADAVEVSLSRGEGLGVDVRMQALDKLEYYQDLNIGVQVYKAKPGGFAKGNAHCSDTSSAAIDKMVEAALAIAQYTSADEASGVPEQAWLATEFKPLDLYHPWPELTVEHAIEMASQCEQAAFDHDSRISNSDGANLTSYSGGRVVANSLGFNQLNIGSHHSLAASVIAQQGDSMQTDYHFSSARRASALLNAEAIGQKAAERTVARLNATQVPTQKAPVLFDARISRSLLGHLNSAISGAAQYRKTSFLLDAVGQQVLPDFVRIHQQPFIEGGLGSCNYDSEGVAAQQRDLVTGGVIQHYITSSYSARKLGIASSGNASGTHNLTLEPTVVGDDSQASLIKQMGTGFWVTDLIGSGVNPVTGDYSRGAAGFWVENGEVTGPIESMTIAGNLKDMFQNIVAIGDDSEPSSSVQCGSILLGEVTIAS